jgi:hypothetical protein
MVLTRIVNKKDLQCTTVLEDNLNKKCYFCGGNHMCRDCPQEAILSPILKKYIGSIMENFIGNNFECPCCHHKTMKVLGNHSPSLDIICTNCKRRFEVKSKCLSVNHLPNDLKLPHGSYDDYLKRQNNGLDLFVIIYKVDRVKKKITIREVLYAKHQDIIKEQNILVVKRKKSHLSTILIKDKHQLKKMNMNQIYQFDFSGIIEKYMENLEKIKQSIFEESQNLII